MWTNDKMTENEILNRFDTNLAPHPKDLRDIPCPKTIKKEGYPSSIKMMIRPSAAKEKLNPIEQRVLARSREKMSSTWGSLSK